jgi:DNA-directed DNA polymerase III PolC
MGISLVASGDIFFATPDEMARHEILVAMHGSRLRADVAPSIRWHAQGFLRAPRAFAALFRDLPQAVQATRQLAERCHYDPLRRTAVFPRLPGDSRERLHAQTMAGARRRYPRFTPQLHARLEYELRLITERGFADYFLVVADITRYARGLGTPLAGRGSGASSVVAYCLGITNVDPLRFRLPFERFLNAAREDYPDLDIDFCWRLRDRIIAYVYRTYGDDHVAMISTRATLQPRFAFRETAKTLGLNDELISRIVSWRYHGIPRRNWSVSPEQMQVIDQALIHARGVYGFPHHLSVHCGGVVITPDPIAAHAPLQRAAKGVVITQYDKDAAERIGLIKLDLLGNRALSAVAETIRVVTQSANTRTDPEHIPADDAATGELLARGDTVGVNQLESPAMRRLLRQLRPGNIESLMQALALIRPGAASLGMKDTFIRRARGTEPVPPMDPRLDPILKATHGIMLYEDDALQVAAALTGLSADEADRFRRAVTKTRTDEDRRRLSQAFLSRCSARNVSPELAADLWMQMAKFNAYSFCRAHAASYAQLAWTGAYLKAHHPVAFWVGALNNNDGMYPRWVYIEEIRRNGIPVLPPCVNESGEGFSQEGNTIRIGLGVVRELSVTSRKDIFSKRPFADLWDLMLRTRLQRRELENLVRAGALDFTAQSRPRLLYELDMHVETAVRHRGTESLFELPQPETPTPPLPDFSPPCKRSSEWELLGLTPAHHPLQPMRQQLTRNHVIPSRQAQACIGRRVRMCGIPAAARTAPTSRGQSLCFITLSDEDGLFEVTLQPEVYAHYRQALADCRTGIVWVEGKLESRFDAICLNAERLGRYPKKEQRR